MTVPLIWKCFLAGLLLLLPNSAIGAPPDWEKLLGHAERRLRDGKSTDAIVALQQVLNLNNQTLEEDRMPRELMAAASLQLANLLSEASRVEEAESAYRQSITAADAGSDLQFRAQNDLAVFLMLTGHVEDAEKHLASMERVARGKNSIFISRYLYNYGKALEMQGAAEEALARYLSSVVADPEFRPASDALREAALSSGSPASGIKGMQLLAENALAGLDFDGATTYLQEALKRTDWATDESFPDLLTSLVHLLTRSDLDARSFETSWSGLLEVLRSSADDGIVASRVESLFQIYFQEVPPCLDPLDAERNYAAWLAPSDDSILFVDFVQMVADQRLREGQPRKALDRYLLATCLVPTREETLTHLAYALLQHPRLAAEIQEKTTSPAVTEAIAWGYTILERDAEAVAGFVRTAELQVANGDAAAIDALMKRAISFVSGEQAAELIRKRDALFAEVGRLDGQVTVTELTAQVSSYRVADFLGVPHSRGSLSLAALVVPSSLSSHVSLTTPESGQNELGVLRGAGPRNNVLKVDHVTIDGPPMSESSSAYYALEALETIDVAGNTANSSVGWSGLHVNLVTKHPENHWASSAAYAASPRLAQGEHAPDSLDLVEGQPQVKANRLHENQEYSTEVGGPLWKNRAWIWASHGESALAGHALGGARFDNLVADTTFKLETSPFASDFLSASFSRKDRRNRGVGAGVTRSQESTLIERGDTDLWRLEYKHMAPGWSLSGLYSRTDGSYSAVPEEETQSDPVIGSDGVWRGGFRSDRLLSVTDDWLLTAMVAPEPTSPTALAWQGRIGASFRQTRSATSNFLGRRNSVSIAEESLASDFSVARLYRVGRAEAETEQSAAWFQQTFRSARLTVDLGGRYDRQLAGNRGAIADANPILPELLPAVRQAGSDDLDWVSFSPRIGLAYASGSRIFRLSYSRFASPVQLEYILRTNAASPAYAQLEFSDLNGNGSLDDNEAGSLRFLSANGFDSRRPEGGSANRNSPDLKPETTDELMLSLEIPVSRSRTFSLSATFRRVTRIFELRELVHDGDSIRLATRNDFVPSAKVLVPLPSGQSTSIESYTLRPGLSFTGGSLLTNGDREQEFLDLRAIFSRDMGERGKLRGSITYHKSRWALGPKFRLFDDPTNAAQTYDPSGVSLADNEGDAVAAHPAHPTASDNPFLQSPWAVNFNGTFKLPLQVLAGTNINFHQGYPLPYFATILPADGVDREVQATLRSDSFRLPDLWVLDLRIERTFVFREVEATGSLDGFNVLDRDTPLERHLQLNGPQANFLLRTLNPRTIRLGLRLRWRS